MTTKIADESKETTLHRNPFWILGVTTRDNRHHIVEQAEEKALHLDHELCHKARSDLTNPRSRLAAEIAWMPGLAPRTAQNAARTLLTDPASIRWDKNLPDLARANLMAAAFEVIGEDESAETIANLINDFAWLVEYMDAEEILRDINEDRAVSGFPEILELDPIEDELSKRRKEYRNAIKEALNSLPPTKLIQTMIHVVSDATKAGEEQGPHLVDELVDAYEVETQGFLDREYQNISTLVETLKAAASKGAKAVDPLLDKLTQVARNWDRVAQPIQLSMKSRGILHQPSHDVAVELRGLGIYLFNKHDLLDQAQGMVALLQELFAELPEFLERLDEDAEALEGIRENAEEQEKSRIEWEKDISFRAEIGLMFKDVLSITPSGIAWKDKRYPLGSITRVRWGGIRHSVNGIPTGTEYTMAFGDSRSEAVVTLKKDSIYQEFVDKLWRAVGFRLLVDMLKALEEGESFGFGDILVQDGAVTLTKHKFLGADERVQLSWHDVKVWSEDGSFVIGSQHDKKTYGTASYIHTANTHLLEHVVRNGFKKGVSRLSEYLKK